MKINQKAVLLLLLIILDLLFLAVYYLSSQGHIGADISPSSRKLLTTTDITMPKPTPSHSSLEAILEGTLQSEDSQPFPHIKVQAGEYLTITNKDGRFVLHLSLPKGKAQLIFEFSDAKTGEGYKILHPQENGLYIKAGDYLRRVYILKKVD